MYPVLCRVWICGFEVVLVGFDWNGCMWLLADCVGCWVMARLWRFRFGTVEFARFLELVDYGLVMVWNELGFSVIGDLRCCLEWFSVCFFFIFFLQVWIEKREWSEDCCVFFSAIFSVVFWFFAVFFLSFCWLQVVVFIEAYALKLHRQRQLHILILL